MSDEKKTCTNCKNCHIGWSGYSEWTVMGNTYACMLEKQADIDTWDNDDEDAWRGFAQSCDSFLEGVAFNDSAFDDHDDKTIDEWLRLNPDLPDESANWLRARHGDK